MGSYRGGYIYRGDPALIKQNAAIMAARPVASRPVYGRSEAPCGTAAAFRRHRRRREKACPACLAAERLRNAEARERRRRTVWG